MAKTIILTIADESIEDLHAYHKQEYAHLSFNKMFIDVVVREMKKRLNRENK